MRRRGRAAHEALRLPADQGDRARRVRRGAAGAPEVDQEGLRHEAAQQIRDGEQNTQNEVFIRFVILMQRNYRVLQHL